MKWLAPLIIVIILIIFGAWFCNKHEPPPANKPPVNANTNKANTAVLVNANSAANSNSVNTAGNTNAPGNTHANVPY